MTSGIYKIEHIESGKVYVGSAIDIDKRWARHKLDLRKGTHPNFKLKEAWKISGKESFVFSILEEVKDLNQLIPREQYWIDLLDSQTSGFNVLPTAGNCLGRSHSDETKLKIAITNKTHYTSKEVLANHSALLTGKKRSTEARERMSQSRKDYYKNNPDACERNSAAQRGRVLTQEWKSNISAGVTGVTRSEETRMKMSIAKKAYWEAKKNPPN